MNKQILQFLSEKYGDAFYLIDTQQFTKNYIELYKAFSEIYPNFNIAYSYKTNYTPKLCGIVNKLGGYAEVVSEMELEIAERIGVIPSNIIWNGPYKNPEKMGEFLLAGGCVNIDSDYDFKVLQKIAAMHPDTILHVGIRCNFDIGDGIISRFGVEVGTPLFEKMLEFMTNNDSIDFIGFQCHFASRNIETWKVRVSGMLSLLDKMHIVPKRIDLGGGLFGKMADSLKVQFDSYIPAYKEYAEIVAPVFKNYYSNCSDACPELIIEPGSALVGDCMRFVSRVVNIKNIRGKDIATVLGSIYNINPTLNKKNPPIEIVAMGDKQRKYDDLDFGGFTCIESDYLYRNYSGMLAVNDFAVFGNVGSYSIVLKPPFILPNFPVIELNCDEDYLIKRGENFDDLFHTFEFGD